MEGDSFTHLGNVAKFGIAFVERTNKTGDQKSFTSDESVDVTFTAKGGAPVAGGAAQMSASVEIKFSKKDSVFFNAAGCLYTMIEDKVDLGQSIMKEFGSGKWKREWALVTDLVRSRDRGVVRKVRGTHAGGVGQRAQDRPRGRFDRARGEARAGRGLSRRVSAADDSDEIKTEQSPEALFFGQLK